MVLQQGFSFTNKMSESNIKNWIIDWFSRNSNLEKSQIEQNTNENYLLKGWIDSLKFIQLITEIEEAFNIMFSNDEFQQREFSTILGLTQVIGYRINEKI